MTISWSTRSLMLGRLKPSTPLAALLHQFSLGRSEQFEAGSAKGSYSAKAYCSCATDGTRPFVRIARQRSARPSALVRDRLQGAGDDPPLKRLSHLG